MAGIWGRFWRRSWWIKGPAFALVVIIVLVIIGTAVGGGSNDNDSETAKSTDAPETTATSEVSAATPIPTAETASWGDGVPLSPESATGALADGDEMTRSLNIGEPQEIQIDGDYISVTYKAGDALSETDLLTIGAQTSFSAHHALFANPNVGSVTVIMLADWIDQLGNSTPEVTTVSTLERATVQQIDWGGLEDLVLGDNKHMFCVSDDYRIHPGIYSRLGDTGCLSGPISAP